MRGCSGRVRERARVVARETKREGQPGGRRVVRSRARLFLSASFNLGTRFLVVSCYSDRS